MTKHSLSISQRERGSVISQCSILISHLGDTAPNSAFCSGPGSALRGEYPTVRKEELWTNPNPHPGRVTVLHCSCLAALSFCVRFSSCWECWWVVIKDSASRSWR